MHAIRQHRFGPAEELVLEERPDLEAGPGQVRIDVRAAGVHLIHARIRAGIAMGDLLAPGGRIIVHGWASGVESLVGDEELAERGLTSTMALGPRMFEGPDGPITLRDLEQQALAEVAAHRWLPVVHPPFPLADAAEAHRAIEGRQVTGKVVLTP